MGCLFASSWSSLRQIRKTRYQDIYFAGGCFWGTEKYFKLVKGVVETEVGYANGITEMFFKAIDPTSVNQQGEDKGTRYRTGVYYVDPDKQGVGSILKQVFEEQSRIYGNLI